MAYARDVFTGTGSPQTLVVSFPVLQRSHIEVLVDDALQVEGVGYTFVTDTSISITAPAASEIVIQRNTSRGSRLTNYIDGTNLGQAPLNSDSKQAFYMAQEALDAVSESDTRLTAEIDGVEAALVGALSSINALQAADVGLDSRLDALEASQLAQDGDILAHDARLDALEGGGGPGVTDHGALTGLSDNDHPQYALASALGSAAYANTSAFAANLHDHDAGEITSGVLDPAHIPDITASKIDSGAATDGYVLTADGAGGAAWEAPTGGSGSPGGSNTQIQFNDAGAFGGTADFTWDKTNNILTFGNSSRIRGPMNGTSAATELAFVNSETNGDTYLNARPNGSGGASGAIFWGASSGSGGYTFIAYQSSTGVIDTSSGIPLSFRCGAGQVARFFPGGNVLFGTGTADPDVAFKVTGAAEFDSTMQGMTRVGINNTNSGSYNAGLNQLVVGSASGNQGITIASGNAAYGQLGFADGTVGDQAYRGIVAYNHADDSMGLWTSAAERLNLTGVRALFSVPVRNTDGTGTVEMTSAAGHGYVGTASNHDLYLKTNGVARVRITNAGVAYLAAPTSGTTDHQVEHTNGGSQVIGYRDIPQNSRSADYTLTLADAAKHIFHPSADTTARTFTIPANASVAFPIGTAITFVNQNAAGAITIAITSDTMRLAGAGTTGSRTLAANGVATALKVTATEWIISGTGLS